MFKLKNSSGRNIPFVSIKKIEKIEIYENNLIYFNMSSSLKFQTSLYILFLQFNFFKNIKLDDPWVLTNLFCKIKIFEEWLFLLLNLNNISVSWLENGAGIMIYSFLFLPESVKIWKPFHEFSIQILDSSRILKLIFERVKLNTLVLLIFFTYIHIHLYNNLASLGLIPKRFVK